MTGDSGNIYDVLDRYFDGEMNGTEELTFKEQLGQNTELKAAYDSEVACRAALVEREMIDLRAELKEDWVSGKATSKGNGWKYGLGGGIICLLSIAVFYLNSGEAPSVNEEVKTTVQEVAVEQTLFVNEDISNLEPNKKQAVVDKTPSVQKQKKNSSNDQPIVEKQTNEIDPASAIENFKTEESATKPDQSEARTSPEKEEQSANQKELVTETKAPDAVVPIAHEEKREVVFAEANEESDLEDFADETEGVKVSATSSCVEDYQKSFTLDMEEYWTVPNEIDEVFTLSIISKTHKTVFTSHSINEFDWDGNDNFGNPQTAGLYKVIVKYESGKRCIYDVTLVK